MRLREYSAPGPPIMICQIRVGPGVVAELDLPGVDQRSQHPQVFGPRAVSSIDEERQPDAGVFGELGVQADHLGVDAVIHGQSQQVTCAGKSGQCPTARQRNGFSRRW